MTQKRLAALLHIQQDTYKMYETRSYLPPHLVQAFCDICGIDPSELFEIPRRIKKRDVA
jgi:DNA-binding XRE family transcriptional regulator